jgi:hypothetical protein
MSLAKALISFLRSKTEITDICGTKIYPSIGEQGRPTPYLAYNITDEEEIRASGGVCARIENVFIECTSKKVEDTDDLAEALRLVFPGTRGILFGIMFDSVSGGGIISDEYDKDAKVYSKILKFKVISS